MPKVKTVAPGRLTGISGLTQTAAESVGRQKDMEYAFEMSEWQKQNARLERLQEEEINTTLEMMKKVTDAEAVGRGDFSVGLRDGLMAQAGKVARINSRMKLGDYDVVKGSQELASIDKQLETFVNAAAPEASVFNLVKESRNLNAGEVGKLMLPTDTKAAEMQNDFLKVINTMNSPESGKVKPIFGDDGSVILQHEDGERISLNAFNDIMTGENPEYPLQFVKSPDEALDPLYKTFEKETSQLEGYRKNRKVTVENADGSTETVVKKMYDIGENSRYREDLKKVVQPILDDTKQMDNYWPNLVGNNNSPWVNSEEQREEAQKLLVDRIDNLYGPKVDVITSPSGEETFVDIVSEEYKERSELEKLKIKKAEKDLSPPPKTKTPIKINEEDQDLYDKNVRSAKQALIIAKKQGKKEEAKFIARVLNKRAIKPGEVKDYSFKVATDVYDQETLKNENIDPNSIYIIKGDKEQLYPIDMSNENEILRVLNSESGFEDEYLETLKSGGMRSGDFEITNPEVGKYGYRQTTFRPKTDEQLRIALKKAKKGDKVVLPNGEVKTKK